MIPIKIIPVNIWLNQGNVAANHILFTAGAYSFEDGTLRVEYALRAERTVNEIVEQYAVANGEVIVPYEITNIWNVDNQIYTYILGALNLTIDV